MKAPKVLPEKDELWPLVIRTVVMVAVGMLATGKAENIAVQADTELKLEEQIEIAWNARDGQGELVKEMLITRAKCDSALESFARHRDDERDWAHVLEECHSEDVVYPTDDPSLPAEDPNQ